MHHQQQPATAAAAQPAATLNLSLSGSYSSNSEFLLTLLHTFKEVMMRL